VLLSGTHAPKRKKPGLERAPGFFVSTGVL
jgi:hypothetical protein